MGSKGQVKLLITGGLGNLGSWLTDYFAQRGYHITVLSKQRKNFFDHVGFDFIECDIADIEQCRRSLQNKKFDYIIHAASSNDFFIDGYYEDALRINALGTRNILEFVQGSSIKKFIYFSTFHVYGKQSGSITEETIPEPVNDYAVTHLFAELYVKQFHKNFSMPYAIIRLTNSYGCPKDINSTKWYLILNDLSRMAYDKGEIVLKTNGKASRDFIWMGDVCKVLGDIIDTESIPNGTFNLSAEQNFQVIQIAEMVREVYNKLYGKNINITINNDDLNTYSNDLLISSQKLKEYIRYQPEIKFKSESEKIFRLLEKHDSLQ